MKISVFGLGYVGCVTAACLAQDGHMVTGVDINPHKINLLQKGKSPISEPGLEEMLGRFVKSGQLQVTSDGPRAVQESEISLIA
jgi:GDP-mannose 6-dehydrogenase